MNPQEEKEKMKYVKRYSDCERMIWESIHSLESRDSYYAGKTYDEAGKVRTSRDEHPLESYLIQKKKLDAIDEELIEKYKREQIAIRETIMEIPTNNWKDCIWEIYIENSDIETFSRKKGVSRKTANRWMKQGLQALVIK